MFTIIDRKILIDYLQMRTHEIIRRIISRNTKVRVKKHGQS
jgi:hypothetical protein